MPNYIINRQEDEKGLNEVHTTNCNHLPLSNNQVSIGWHADAISAVAYAKQNGWSKADGCYYCCNEAHHG